ncbi:Hsp20/alpha crystallin family protein [Desulfofustis glycolicus]|uniref:HSP20 family protein n=1 Tax=Desulfofustis glycolicus DSM 9705 TaxID=1121409 RepID=A0A1M5SX57_9BACT|nr:Hsp20/alpha crystallin family protein [Desulfofustis glycolicus]MCB2215247.1 Hsp20/alpha crystallin family protein [Desulfobulbaceae bacterium]SHH43141.1 HSP20 family protein [Desulfofustis glycolicus DSM 9705]
MDLKKLAPWNWFKNEDEEAAATPVRINRPRKRSDLIDPYHPLYHFQQQMEQFFDSWAHDLGMPGRKAGESGSLMAGSFLKPSVNIGGNEKEYSISVEIPGVEEKDIKVEIKDDTLTISGEKQQEKEDRQKDFYRIERSYGSFRRVLTLPDDADRDGIKAGFRKGVLQLTIPKKAVSKADVKQIEVRSAD